ncbi:MAG TPA: hypothetical protein VNP20_20325 [Nocardioidaceae bacterium]|nr:hypothetical protein [Nocardioidaceae bacterium]
MRALRVVMTVAGLCLGLAGAVAWHHYEFFRGTVTWIAYSAGPGADAPAVSFDTSWWPELLVGSVAGVTLGLVLATSLGRFGWRFVRHA